MTTTVEVTATQLVIDPELLASVYSGRSGACACGCSGNHRYCSRVAADGQRIRGYEIGAEEVNDRQVRRIAKVIGEIANGERDGYIDFVRPDFISAVSGKRSYIAYWDNAAPAGFMEAHGWRDEDRDPEVRKAHRAYDREAGL